MPFPWTVRSCAWAISIHPFFPTARAYRVVGSLGAEPSTSPTCLFPFLILTPFAPPDSPTARFLPLSPAPLHQTLRPSPYLRLPTRHLPVASSAAPSGAAASATERPRFLERCGLNADEFDDDAEAEPTVALFGREEEGKAIVMAGSGLSLLSGSGNVLPFVLASPSSSQKIPHYWLHR
uniref:Uncharacterized protein n=1 Tax=Oryza glumipatula TaxID=40148 RepID=A0A0E0BBM4_9ORYZ